ALTGKLLNITSVSELRPLSLPQYNTGIDCHLGGSKIKSLLTIPLKNSRNEIIAVLQLADKKQQGDEHEPSFEIFDESLLSSFATQAAICLENVDLYADIQRL